MKLAGMVAVVVLVWSPLIAGADDSANRSMCEGWFEGADRKECIRVSKLGERNLAHAIKMCAVHMSGPQDALSCLRAATLSTHVDPGSAIKACSTVSQRVDWPARKTCVTHAMEASYPVEPTIKACFALTSVTADRLSCLAAAAKSRTDFAPTIAACRHHASDREKLRCLGDRALQAGSGSPTTSPAPAKPEKPYADEDDDEDDNKDERRKERGASLEAIATACNAVSYSASEREACVRDVSAARFDGTGAVAACIGLSYSTPERLACVKSAMASRRDPSTGIKACIALSYSTPERLTCVAQTSAGKARFAASVVAACTELSYSTPERLACVKSAMVARKDPAPGIKACIGLSYSTPERLTCVANSNGVSADVIAACVTLSYSTPERLTCIKHASQVRKREALETVNYCIKRSYSTPERLACIQGFTKD